MTSPGPPIAGRIQIPDDERPRGLRERLAALRYLPALVRLVWQTHAAAHRRDDRAAARARVRPRRALWVAKLIIDAVVALTRTPGGSLTPLWRVVALELAIVVVGELLARASALVESLLGDLFSNHISVRLMRHAATLDLAQFEDPEFYDHLERARRQTTARIGAHRHAARDGAGSRSRLLTLGAALVAYNPWLLALLTVAILPSFLGETHFASLAYSLLFSRTPERRELDYLRYVGASDKTAKEVQMFGLAGWLDRPLRRRWRSATTRRTSASASGRGSSAPCSRCSAPWATTAPTSRSSCAPSPATITLGTLTFLAAAFGRSRDLIQRLLLSASDIYEQSLYLRDLFVFFEMQPSIHSKPGAAPVPRPIRDGFVFEDVGFQYPGSDRWAIRHVDPHDRPRRADRARRRERRGQDDDHQAPRAALRPDRGPHPARRRRSARLRPRVAARGDRRDLPGLRALRHALRRERRRRRDRGGVGLPRDGPRRDERKARHHRPTAVVDAVRALTRRVAAAALRRRLPPDARAAVRGRRRPLGRRMAEGRPGARLHARGAAPHPGRADGGAGRARRVRGVRAIQPS